MKKLILIFLLGIVGCTDTMIKEIPLEKNDMGKVPYNTNIDRFYIIIMDSCEYITMNSFANKDYAITHKGNCNNPIHYK